MLRDYFWSLTFVTAVLLTYTALVLLKRPATEPGRSSASLKPSAAFAPTSEVSTTLPSAATIQTVQ